MADHPVLYLNALSPRDLVLRAIEQDSDAEMAAALSYTERSKPKELESLLQFALNRAVDAGATSALDCALSRGADHSTISGWSVSQTERNFAQTIAVLQKHGWSVDKRKRLTGPHTAWPLLWLSVKDDDRLQACLAAGASLVPIDQDPDDPDDAFGCSPVLERVAEVGTLAGLRTLLNAGAPPGRRMLHFAARCAVDVSEGHERLNVVRELVEGELRCDVNADDQPEGKAYPGHYGPPLCWVASMPGECAAIVRYLLGKGADPRQKNYFDRNALELARSVGNTPFIDEVRKWEAERGAGQSIGGSE